MKQMNKPKSSSQQQGGPDAPPVPNSSQADSPGDKMRRLAEWILLPLRLFLGVTFVYAGIQKLTDPQYFNHSAPGYIGKQILGFAFGSPIHNFLVYAVVPHATFFGALVAFGELAIGLGTLLGLLLRPAAFFGLLLSLMFFLSASWRVYPYFYGADIVFVFCWITMLIAGPEMCWLPALDTWLVARLLEKASPARRLRMARVYYILLGVREQPQLATNSGAQQAQGRVAPGGKQVAPKARLAALRQQQQSRRNFLWGLVTGGASMLGIVAVWQVLNRIDSSNEGALPPPTSGSGSGGTSGTATASGTPGTIAQISAVPANSSVSFTIPSNGDPGVLVHLNNGQFVAFDATCTHAGCPVSYDPSSQLLLCPCHGAQFDPARGAAVVSGPAPTPLTSVPINVNNATGTISISGQ
ncbi:MAG TPA: TQO small subunit DoxD [Ktedonobacteraceae bacterium]|nr:TQO small subunit DoxD [Ktedonobacteraceae bacterium]